MENSDPRFVADGNVGTLARRLRMLGFDAVFAHPVADDELVRIAQRDGRVLLTRDVYVLHRRPVADGTVRAILIIRDDIASQVRQVLRSLDLHAPFASFSRCLKCNVPLVPTTREDVADEVPPFVYQTHRSFTRCPRCRRIFWSGTHRQRMLRELSDIIGEDVVEGEGEPPTADPPRAPGTPGATQSREGGASEPDDQPRESTRYG